MDIKSEIRSSKILKASILLMLLVVVFTSCNWNKKPETTQKAAPADTLSNDSVDVAILTGMPEMVREKLPRWVKYIKSQNPYFDLHDFQLTDSTDYNSTMYDGVSFDFAPKQFMDLYRPYLIQSPDSSDKYLDIYSYHIKLQQMQNGDLKGLLSPDNEVALVYPGQNIRERLLFLGPAATFDDAFWINANKLVVAGTEVQNGHNVARPVFWEFDLLNNIIKQYTYLGELQTPMTEYYKVKMPNVDFDWKSV